MAIDRTTRDRIFKWGTVGILLAVAIGFAIQWAGNQLGRDESGNVVDSSNTSIDLARVGDCIRELPADTDEVDKVYIVPCAEPHQVEVVGMTSTTETGSQEAAQTAFGQCLDVYEEATGIRLDPNDLAFTPVILAPNQDRPQYLCLIDYGERLTGAQATFQPTPAPTAS